MKTPTPKRRQSPEAIARKIPAQILYLRAATMRIVERLERLQALTKRAGL
jgi:hypothetical protein